VLLIQPAEEIDMLPKTICLVLLAMNLAVQTEPAIKQHNNKAGDALRFTIGFDGKPDVKNITVLLSLQTPILPTQMGFRQNWETGSWKRLEDGQFEVSGTIPDDIATGTWQVTGIGLQLSSSASKLYGYPDQLQQKVTVDVVNDKSFQFPRLKSFIQN
jgi:hypothetical protein